MWSPTALHVLSLMVFWGQIQNYMMRQNLSILIVAMVKEGDDAKNETVAAESCVVPVESPDGQRDDKKTFDGDFEWDAMTRGLILSAFGYGYVTTQLIGGRMAEKYGVKAVYGRCLAVCGVLTLLSPPVAKWGGAWAFAALRILQARNISSLIR